MAYLHFSSVLLHPLKSITIKKWKSILLLLLLGPLVLYIYMYPCISHQCTFAFN